MRRLFQMDQPVDIAVMFSIFLFIVGIFFGMLLSMRKYHEQHWIRPPKLDEADLVLPMYQEPQDSSYTPDEEMHFDSIRELPPVYRPE
ncbi:hypothetical protein HDV06_002054 [Boothiomyces sp. JEL0866]|nr:hypothetical protein HDV06_002054 [Boothiomyces sp. JEL0866]